MSRIQIQRDARRVRVRFSGLEIADSTRALWLDEAGYPTRYYFPPEDVRVQYLTPTAHKSVCPFKGRASYWSVHANGHAAENAVWAYLTPIADCAAIADCFAFDPAHVEIEVG
ncbi:MAG: DUF427 domain-containing protein [Alphaproteobacteria bacterium]|nr:DUF427 domain-containing protein [Alphaproteobacteria bacterium]